MVWFSTSASIREQQISILALIETTIAIAVSILLFKYFGSIIHIAIVAALAPFLLLQTSISNRRSLKFIAIASRIASKTLQKLFPRESWFKNISKRNFWIQAITALSLELYIALTSMSLYLLLILSCIVAKPAIVIASFLSAPLATISAIPENWRKAVLITDSAAVPELVPGIEDRPGINDYLPLTIGEVLNGPGSKIVGVIFFAIFLYMPAVSYRWSLKATAIIWSPLLWAFRPMAQHDDPLHFAKGIIQLSKYKITRVYSAIVVLVFAMKLAILFAWAQLSDSVSLIPNWDVVAHYLSPQTIPLWHVAAVLNAILTWAILFRAEHYLHEAKGGKPVPISTAQNFFRSIFILRNLLAIYVVACAVYLTFEIAGVIAIPAIRIIIFPWS